MISRYTTVINFEDHLNTQAHQTSLRGEKFALSLSAN